MVVQLNVEPHARSVLVGHTVVLILQNRFSDFFRFYRFAHKIQTINPFSVPFSLTGSLHLALSHSTKNSSFSHPKIAYSKSLITICFPKSLKLAFHIKTQVSSQNLSQAKLITKKRSSTK